MSMAQIKNCPACGAPVTLHERRTGSEMTYWLEAKSPRWIPVEERLPNHGENVLIIIKEKWYDKIERHVDIAEFRDDGGGYLDFRWDTVNDWDEGQEIHVTHWMPLPEPPEEEA